MRTQLQGSVAFTRAPRPSPPRPLAQVLEAAEEREALLGLSRGALDLLKSHKRASCLDSLLSYGFSEAQADAAADAAGSDHRLAAQMLFGGQACEGFQPVDVTE